SNADVKVQEEALRLAGKWKVAELVPDLASAAEGKTNRESFRSAAFSGLREIGGDSVKAKLKTMAEAQDPWSKRQAILTWAGLDFGGASAAAVSALMKIEDEKE